jgi:hypothetical protein
MKKGILIFILATSIVKADRGMLPIIPDVSIYGTGQKAIILWNGNKEVIILSVDAYADTKTKVLEVLPLPSEPKIDTVSIESFKAIQRLIIRHAPRTFWGRMRSAFKGAPKGVQILFHKKIGPHNITCAKALRYQEFVNWTYKFIKSQGIDTISFPSMFPSIIQEYMRQGIAYFVFDIIELDETTSSIAPLRYEFTSPYLFFPLSISRLAKGETTIQLFLITEYPPWPGVLGVFKIGKYMTYGRRKGGIDITFEITKDELKSIDQRSTRLFSTNPWFTALKYKGPIYNLREDLRIQKFCKIIEY